MRVKVEFVVDIDARAWNRDYGVAAQDIRADVRRYIENGVRAQLADLGLLVEPKPVHIDQAMQDRASAKG